MTQAPSTNLPVQDSLLNIVLHHEARATADEVRRMAYELQAFRSSLGATAAAEPSQDYPALPKAVTRRDTGSLLDKGRAITLLREYVDADRAAHKETFLHAAYYKWLREQHWYDSQMFVVTGGKESVKLGVVCPSGDRLDTMIAEAIAKEKEKEKQ